jgi:ferric-dicitrate binding protein FerR (iron transport regulator)
MSDEIESLIDAVIDGTCDEADRRRLEQLVRDDPRVREAYLDQIRVHALLEWRHGRVEPRVACPAKGPGRWRTRRRLRWGLAAVALLGIGLSILASRSPRPGPDRGGVATLLEAREVVWSPAMSPIIVNDRVSPRVIRCESGVLRLAFDSGALVTLEGPADLEILSGMHLRAYRGRITALVDGKAKGFTVETPSTNVVDRGTEFGVEIDASGRTGVVVFRGVVDLSNRKPALDGPSPITTLGQGEAVRVDPAGVQSRIIEVDRHARGDGWSTGPSSESDAVIRSVGDNIRGLESSKYYQIVHHGLFDDAPAYVDRPHEWNGLDASGLPGFLQGADYVMPFNDDKWLTDLEITVDLARPASLYVFLDDREKPPAWLTGQFADTGVNIGLDEGSWPDPTLFQVDKGAGRSINHVFSVWKRVMDGPGSVRLGSLQEARNNRCMYGIAAVALP